jgi:hypothetical protein
VYQNARKFAVQDQVAPAYPIVSVKPDILGVVEPSTTTAGGDLKEPDEQKVAKWTCPSARVWDLPANLTHPETKENPRR